MLAVGFWPKTFPREKLFSVGEIQSLRIQNKSGQALRWPAVLISLNFRCIFQWSYWLPMCAIEVVWIFTRPQSIVFHQLRLVFFHVEVELKSCKIN